MRAIIFALVLMGCDMTNNAAVQPLAAQTVEPGKAVRVFSGRLDDFGGVSRILLVSKPMGTPIGYNSINDSDKGFAWKQMFPYAMRAIAELRLQSRDKTRIAWLDLDAFLEVNIAAIEGEIYVYNQQFIDYPANLIDNVPISVNCAKTRAEVPLELPTFTHFLVNHNNVPPPAPGGGAWERYIPIQPQAKRVIFTPSGQLDPYFFSITTGQYISDTTAVVGVILSGGEVERQQLIVDIPGGGSLLQIVHTNPFPINLPLSYAFEVEP